MPLYGTRLSFYFKFIIYLNICTYYCVSSLKSHTKSSWIVNIFEHFDSTLNATCFLFTTSKL